MKILKWIVTGALLITATGCATSPATQAKAPRRLDSSLLRFYEPAPDTGPPQLVVNERAAHRPARKSKAQTGYPVQRASAGHHLVAAPVAQ
jgi:hypothetical protein